MAIKFDNGANPSKIMWKSSPSATEQEVFNIKMGGNSVWAKPYTLKSVPSCGKITTETPNLSLTKLIATSQIGYRCSTMIISHDSYSDWHESESATLTLPGGETITILLDREVKLSHYYGSQPKVITNMGSKITGLCLEDTYNDEPLPTKYPLLISASTDVSLSTAYRNTNWVWNLWGPLHQIRLVGETYYSTDKPIDYDGIGVLLKVKGKRPLPHGQTPEEVEWHIPIMFYYEESEWVHHYSNNGDYNGFANRTKFDRIAFPITLRNADNAADSSIIYKKSDGTTGYCHGNIDNMTTSNIYLHTSGATYLPLSFSFACENVVNSTGASFSRYASLEPTASLSTLSVNSTVYWGDVLRLSKNNTKLQEWTIDQYIADSGGNVYLSGSVLEMESWSCVYYYNKQYIYAGDAVSLNYITVTEQKYSASNHKTTGTTTSNYVNLSNFFEYVASEYWKTFSTKVEQKKGGYTHTDNFTETRSYGIPSSITTPTITVSDLGTTYVNIKIVNNSSYAGSYHLSFKAYHQLGNPVSYTYSGSIGANSTAIPTINISSYSSQGPIKGIAGTGQIYCLGKGSSSASFSRGDTGGNSGGGDVCLIKNTPILMADNTTKPIQDIVVGDEILGYDFENNCTTPTVVMYSIPTKFQQQAHYVIFDNGKTLCTTRGHELYVVEYGRYVPVEDIKEGEHCLDENGNETEVLVIHYDVELKTFEQFYHIVSSNNTYYANGILNVGVPIDKYRYIHDLRGENIPEPIEALIMDESKDTACFNFTVTNPEFLQKGTPFQSKIKKSHNRISDLEKLIVKLDEAIAKVAAGLGLDDEYEKLKAKYYKEIAELQEKIVNWEEDYNKLLAQYSDIGEDILLDDKERRRKYFRRANKIANDNFAVYKANYVRDPAPRDLGEGVEFIRAEDDYLK